MKGRRKREGVKLREVELKVRRCGYRREKIIRLNA